MREPLPEQKPQDRTRNFTEVALGYSKEQAIKEASRCIQCKKPLCVTGCPVEIDIPAFIKLIVEDKPAEALAKIKEKNNLPAVCGRVCPQEDQCEKMCILGKKDKENAIGIGYLERYAADYGKKRAVDSIPGTGRRSTVNGQQVAVVGSGPAGLTCAADLAKLGYQVTLFESLHEAGGVLSYGIPEFRLPKAIVREEIEYIRSLGVELKTSMLIGGILGIEDLFKRGYKAVFIGSGAGLPQFLNIPGENLMGVYSANEFLVRVNLMKAYQFPEHMTPVRIGKKVAVVGAGNVAMDAARVSLRLGAEKVSIVYRRSRTEMPARAEEIIRAEEEGIEFKLLTAPVRIIGDPSSWVKQLECLAMELGEPDASGRRRPVPVKGSEFLIDADTVIIAIGQSPNPLLSKATPDLKTEKWGGVIADPSTGQTSMKGVFAGGDIVTGAATVISAMGAGKKAARAIDDYLRKG
ncbi:MAG: NADPH-dependent glutamate synthase [Candidatus Margulisiibacteriota bacterium]